MNTPINSISANMQQLQQNDNTLKGGFLSITGGRYRIIIGPGGNPALELQKNPECNGTNAECDNTKCPDSNNTKSCTNGTCVIVGTSGSGSSYSQSY